MNNENNKPNNLGQGKIIFVIVAIAVIILLCIGGYLLGYKKGSNNTDLDNNDINNNDKDNQNIPYQLKNEEILELYKIVKNGEYYPEYLKTSLEDLDENTLLSIVAKSYGEDYLENITEEMYDKLQNGPYGSADILSTFAGSKYLSVSSDELINKTNQIFNKNITKETLKDTTIYIGEKAPSCFSFTYDKNTDKFLRFDHCGGNYPECQEIIYNGEETSNEFILYTHVTKYKNNGVELVYVDNFDKEYSIYTFKLTTDNMSSFPIIKYVFTKDSNNKYYVSSIMEEK